MANLGPAAGDEGASADVLEHFGVTIRRRLDGGSESAHWLVQRAVGPAVLRRYPDRPFGDAEYELDVLRFLHQRGWPVPLPLSPPTLLAGRTWALFTHLEGEAPPPEDDPARRERGRLLARLHDDTDGLVSIGQRSGWRTSDAVLLDPGLEEAVVAFERHAPCEGHVLRWHLDLGRELLDGIDLANARRTVVHSDLAPWNLLVDHGALTGIVDFAATHLDFAVADFACAWRGRYDPVIEGYDEVRPISDVDRALITPIFWGWLFIGAVDDLRTITAGAADVGRLSWMLSKLPRRTPAMGPRALPYPGG